MDYAAHYDRLIVRARGRNMEGYRERHHVLPRCMGGGNEPGNIVELTPEEHFVAHQLLVRIFPSVCGLTHAANLMAGRLGRNKTYGWLRRRLAVIMLGNTFSNGKPKSPEHRAKIGAAHSGRTHSREHRAKLSAVRTGRKLSKEHIEKVVLALRGVPKPAGFGAKIAATKTGVKRKPFTRRPHSPEHREKLSVARRAYLERRAA